MTSENVLGGIDRQCIEIVQIEICSGLKQMRALLTLIIQLLVRHVVQTVNVPSPVTGSSIGTVICENIDFPLPVIHIKGTIIPQVPPISKPSIHISVKTQGGILIKHNIDDPAHSLRVVLG